MWNPGPYLRQYFVVILMNMSVFAAGMGMVWPSPMLVKLKVGNNTALGRPIEDEEASWVVSVASLTGWVFIFISPYLADQFGRKTTIILAIIPRIIAYFTLFFAGEVWIIIAARLLKGCSDVCTLVVVPVYTSEVASLEIRGGLGAVLSISGNMSFLFIYSIAPFFEFHALNRLIACIVVVTSIPILFLPESPYFLFRKGKTEQAAKVLTFLRCSKSIAYKEMDEYSRRSDPKTNILKEIKKTNVVKGLSLSIFLNCAVMLSGSNILSSYLQPILESSKSSLSSEMATVFVCTVQSISSICSASLSDKFGRRPVIINTFIGMTTGMIGLGAYFKLLEWNYEIDGQLKYIPMICLTIVLSCTSLGLGSVLWPLMSEMLDGPIRAFGICCACSMGSIVTFSMSYGFLYLLSTLGPSITYWIFGGNCIVCCLVVIFFVPETKGKSFAEIQKILGEKLEEE